MHRDPLQPENITSFTFKTMDAPDVLIAPPDNEDAQLVKVELDIVTDPLLKDSAAKIIALEAFEPMI